MKIYFLVMCPLPSHFPFLNPLSVIDCYCWLLQEAADKCYIIISRSEWKPSVRCVRCVRSGYNTQSYIIVEASVHSRLCVQTLGFQRRQIRRPAVILSEIAKMNFIRTLNVSRTPHLIGLKREYFRNCKLIGVACFSPHWCMICFATVPQSGKFWEQFSEVTLL